MAVDRLKFETKLWAEGYRSIIGLDEAGRGCLSGPVMAGGVILKKDSSIEGVRDSKSLSLEERLELEKKIKEKAEFWTVQQCSPSVIDELNILWASLKAMQKCAEAASPEPDYLLVDGNRYLDTIRPHTCIVGGDDRSMSIAAASILAKVHRDRYMHQLHEKFPHYGWDTNVGYATRQHYDGLKNYGYTEHHRQSFKLRTDKKAE